VSSGIRDAGRARILAALAVCCTAAAPTAAQAGTGAGIRASFLPDRIGASATFTLAFKFSGGGRDEVPAPLSRAVVHLPAGLGINLREASVCPRARLQARGIQGCPAGALIGRGHALLELHPASQTITEDATLSAFRGPNAGGRPTIEILSQGYTPLEERTVITGVLQPDLAPYGLKLTLSIPPIPTLVGEPNASTASLSLTIGAGRGTRAHVAAEITVPHSCPAGGFPFAADFTFADGSTASASVLAPCP
jgi:hypothetical protein